MMDSTISGKGVRNFGGARAFCERLLKATLGIGISGLIGVGALEAKEDSNQNLWFAYAGDHPIGESPWGVHLEGQVRRANYGRDWQQYLLRPGINYQYNANLSFSVGYAWVETDPYGDLPIAREFPEHRIWEQAVFQHSALGLSWTHRVRLEQRNLGEMTRVDGTEQWDVGNWRYENRIRYFLKATVPLTEDKRLYVSVWDEVFFNFGSNVVGNDFDQNRAFVGLGFKFGKFWRGEMGFMEQTLQRRGGVIWEHNHTVLLTVFSNQPFRL